MYWLAIFNLLILLTNVTGKSLDYLEQITQARKDRDARFADPITSPLAQVGGALLEENETIFGSSQGAKLNWKGEGIEPVHLRILKEGSEIFLEPAGGIVLDLETGQSIGRQEWQADRMYRVGSALLVLREHPVGRIVRIIDPNSEKVREFKGLRYFPVDEALRVRARIRPQSPERIKILDTQGWERPARLFGKLTFPVDQESQSLDLILFGEEGGEESGFLIMFRDQTSGKDTYAACRYLEIPFQSEGEVWLDFNRATNPSCAYSTSFACPLPPAGNWLSVPIRAGEKTFSEASH